MLISIVPLSLVRKSCLDISATETARKISPTVKIKIKKNHDAYQSITITKIDETFYLFFLV